MHRRYLHQKKHHVGDKEHLATFTKQIDGTVSYSIVIMATGSQGLRVTSLCSSCLKHTRAAKNPKVIRSFSHSTRQSNPETTPGSSTKSQSNSNSIPANFDLRYAHTKLQLRKAASTKTPLVGSLRYRWAKSTNQGIPFQQLPYQCFQDARAILAEHRDQILVKIENMREKIDRLAQKTVTTPGEINGKAHSLKLMRRQLEQYKVEADMNDPLVKKKFEDGTGKI